MNLKRSAKSFALSLAKSGAPAPVSRSLLNRMRIGFEPQRSELISYPGGRRAACCISVDYDHIGHIARGSKFIPTPDKDKFLLNRAGTRNLIALSEKYSIPLTWAVCGKTAEEDRPTFRKILDSKVGQEVGVHTYGHIDVSHCSEAELEQDLSKCLDVLALSRTPRTFVFPWNKTGHFAALKKMGFSTYRAKERVIGAPRMNEGLLNIPPVYYVDQKSSDAYPLLTHFVDLCIKSRAVFHLWTHPWSVVTKDQPDALIESTLDPLFAYLSKKREEGDLAISTMGEISGTIEDSSRQVVLSSAAQN